ncbi:MAG: hypothetical protein A3E98_04610 [Candidatus Doudnabacteria bacterium RIFCSPHIGHO2_12_FULL_48_11]|uniref:Capsule synthesis protein CapA domain-containing protein n=1 Tax=Candidatus Doudnabacteria bacterium RIFCSPHIGHO2_01_FULL_46_24 TaxID=1817825 RepID=A0A1F5NSX8_9BACT|nr:MAG: hypothetical protein A2720_04080 [Candidatus Doudnabacteria bacterium RIFCSPHIGHO2_01_FULL_46_24]OGE95358.1 MAG: hypothetical protein A3E98_04610 [Candidatus Doudnabacteria bacterium RIFCSPHIGHO2_12_FULL_48_11]
MPRSVKLILLIVAAILIVIVLLTTKRAIEPGDYQPSTINYQPQSVTLFFAGDIMLSRNVHDRMAKAGDFALPFNHVVRQVVSANLSFANLESPFNDQGPHFVPNSLVFNADSKSVAGLVAAGFDILSTANNHAFDQGQRGLEFTRDLLEAHDKAHDILAVGTGEGCHQGKIIEKSGIKFGFLAYSYAAYNDGGKQSDPLVCNWNDSAQTAEDIKLLKNKANFVTVSFHAGTEYKRQPDEKNVALAHAATDAGADLLIGHHPHWIQTIEEYKGKYIFYSLGNFIFDQMWSQETREGLTMTMTITMTDQKPEIKKIELMPVVIDDYCCPRWANSSETASILKKINLTSNILVDNND